MTNRTEERTASYLARQERQADMQKFNPMDVEDHEDIIDDLLESPQWTNGNAGIFRPGRTLNVTLTRSEETFWVSPHYIIDEQQAFDVFYGFLCMRNLYYSQHPELKQTQTQLTSAKKRNAKGVNSLQKLPAGNPGDKNDSSFVGDRLLSQRLRAAPRQHNKSGGGNFKGNSATKTELLSRRQSMRRGYRLVGDELAAVVFEDVERVAHFVCEPDAIQLQACRFMAAFDPDHTGVVTLRQFLDHLEAECDKRELNALERFFFLFDEPTSSRASFGVAMLIMLLIIVSSLGFILATEPVFMVPAGHRPSLGVEVARGGDYYTDDDDLSEPPRAVRFFFYLEAVCIFVFTGEYLARAGTVWAVRGELRSAKIEIPVLQAFLGGYDPFQIKSRDPMSLLNQNEAKRMQQRRKSNAVVAAQTSNSKSFRSPGGVSKSFKLGDKAQSLSPTAVQWEGSFVEGGVSVDRRGRMNKKGVLDRGGLSFSFREGKGGGGGGGGGGKRGRGLARSSSVGGVARGPRTSSAPPRLFARSSAALSFSRGKAKAATPGSVNGDDDDDFDNSDVGSFFVGLSDPDDDEESGGRKRSFEDSPVWRTWRYLSATMNLVDLVAILPFYGGMVFKGSGGGLAVLRVLRLARVFRIFKVGNASEGVTMLSNTVTKSLPALQLIGFFGAVAVVVLGSLIFLVERGVWHAPFECGQHLGSGHECSQGEYLRPDVFGTGKDRTPFSSIPRSFWFVIVTCTTVGYGDMYPTTDMGKIIATFSFVGGMLVLALPITIIGTNFSEEYRVIEENKQREAREREKERLRQRESVSSPFESVSSSVLEGRSSWSSAMVFEDDDDDDDEEEGEDGEDDHEEDDAPNAEKGSVDSSGKVLGGVVENDDEEEADNGDQVKGGGGGSPPSSAGVSFLTMASIGSDDAGSGSVGNVGDAGSASFSSSFISAPSGQRRKTHTAAAGVRVSASGRSRKEEVKGACALVARSLFDSAGSVYQRAQHRVSRAQRLEASEARRQAVSAARSNAEAEVKSKGQRDRTLKETAGSADGEKGGGGEKGAVAAAVVVAVEASLGGVEKTVEGEEAVDDEEEALAAGAKAAAYAAATLTNKDFGYFNDPHVQEPHFLFNARASARTFCGIDLIEEEIPFDSRSAEEVPRQVGPSVGSPSSSSFSLPGPPAEFISESSTQRKKTPSGRAWENTAEESGVSSGVGGGVAAQSTAKPPASTTTTSTSSGSGFALVLKDGPLKPFDAALDAAQKFLDLVLDLSCLEKISEASATNLAREIQTLLRKVVVAGIEEAGKRKEAESAAAANHANEDNEDAASHPHHLHRKLPLRVLDLKLDGAGQAVDSSLAMLFVWLRRAVAKDNYAGRTAAPTSASNAGDGGLDGSSGGGAGSGGGGGSALGVGSDGGEHGPMLLPNDERKLRHCAISFALEIVRLQEDSTSASG